MDQLRACNTLAFGRPMQLLCSARRRRSRCQWSCACGNCLSRLRLLSGSKTKRQNFSASQSASIIVVPAASSSVLPETACPDVIKAGHPIACEQLLPLVSERCESLRAALEDCESFDIVQGLPQCYLNQIIHKASCIPQSTVRGSFGISVVPLHLVIDALANS